MGSVSNQNCCKGFCFTEKIEKHCTNLSPDIQRCGQLGKKGNKTALEWTLSQKKERSSRIYT